MSDWKPTGRSRLVSRRKGLWGGAEQLVLQVEIKGIHTWCIAGNIDSEWVTRWRDARTSDLTTLNIIPRDVAEPKRTSDWMP